MEYKHEDFFVDINMEIITINKFHLWEKVNDHAKLELGGICSRLNDFTSLKKGIVVKDKNEKVIFCGMLSKLEQRNEKDLSSFYLTAYSFSYEMGQAKHKRVFQNLSMTYEDIINKVLRSYNSSTCIDKASNGIKIPHVLIQYDETDWEFLKRLASHFNTGICVNAGIQAIQISFGMDCKDFKEPKNVVLVSKTYLFGKQEQMEVQTYEHFELGCQMLYESRVYFIKAIETFMKKGELISQVLLEGAQEFSFPYLSNVNIAGMHIWAFAKEIHRNQLRIQYQIEDQAQGNIPFLSFSGEENNEFGYYMPEPGDEVEVTFPDSEEEYAFVSAARRNNEETQNDKFGKKYLKNKEGLGLCLDEQKLRIFSGKANASIAVHRNGSVHIEAPESINIKIGANADIGCLTGNMTMMAQNGITFRSGVVGNSRIYFDAFGNIIFKALRKVVVKGSNKIQSLEKGQSQQNDIGAHEMRNAVLALSGVEFLSQSITKTEDSQSTQSIMNQLLGQKIESGPGAEHSTDNFIKEKLFQNNERLFNSFSYGESKRG